jgi:hypothetical protein
MKHFHTLPRQKALHLVLVVVQLASVFGATAIATIQPPALEPLVGAPKSAFAAGEVLRVTKQVTTTDGSAVPSINGTFSVNVNCLGAGGFPTRTLLSSGAFVDYTTVASGTLCSAMEDTTNLPAAPSGYTWAGWNASAPVTVTSNQTGTLTVTNVLAPLSQLSGVLTVTKQVSGTAQAGRTYLINVAGPSNYNNTFTLTETNQLTQVLTGLLPGIYTVTESSPGAGWVTSYTVTSGNGITTTSNAVVTLTNPITATPFAVAQITGTVFNDYNSDGNITANSIVTDTGVPSVTVTAYALNGTVLGPVQTDASGRYTITTSGTQGPYRLEFTNLPAGYEPSRSGPANGTSTQFVTNAGGAGNVNFGVHYPADYCQNNPELCSVIQVAAAYTDTNNATKQAIVTFPYSAGSPPQMANMALYDSPAKGPTLVQNSNVGSTWGLAYRRGTKTIYAAAFMKKHAGFGPNGTGAIYQIAKGSTIASVFADLNVLFGAGTAGVNPHTTTNNWVDDNFNTTWDAVGKTSLGGIAVSEDDTKLYVMNLTDRKLYELPLTATPTVGNSRRSAAAFDSAPGCPASGDVRPFALQVYRGNIYVGVTCTAESSGLPADMRAYVYKVDPIALTWGAPVFQFNLNYPRSWLEAKSGSTTALWRPWVTAYANNSSGPIADINGNYYLHYPQPWLTDIVFDQGNLVLGLRDRLGDQGGAGVHSNPQSPTTLYVAEVAGDTLRACGSLDNWVLESNARCGGLGNGPQNNTGANAAHNGPGNGEFYWREEWQWLEVGVGSSASLPAFAGDVFHSETSMGSLAQIPGYPDVLATTFDPVPWRGNPLWSATWDSGIHWWNNKTGDFTKAYRVVDGGSSLMSDYFGKANGLGDLAILCDAAPIEIGNRAWNDVDGDGVQDAGEAGLNGVQVTLSWPGGSINTTTSVDGNYVFTREAATGAYSQTLASNKAYTITFGVPAGYTLTVPNAQALAGASVSSNDAISDVRDSDAVLIGNVPTILYVTGSAGKNNHGLDAGYTQPVSASVNITNTPPPPSTLGAVAVRKLVTTTDGSAVPAVSGMFNIQASCVVTPSALGNGGSMTFTGIPSGTVCAAAESTLNLPAAPTGYTWAGWTAASAVTVTANQTSTITVTNLLAPLPTGTGVLTVTKTVNGAAQAGRTYQVNVSGPSGYNSSFTLTETAQLTRVLTGLLPGIYTVTESSPGAGWVTSYTVTSGNGITTTSNAVVTLTNPITATPFAATVVTGTVYQDFNANGNRNTTGTSPNFAVDAGISNVVISAYGASGAFCGSASTNISGTYSFTPSCAGPWRLEYTNLPSGYEPSRVFTGTQNGTSVQFITSTATATGATFGINRPVDYCQNNPLMCTSQMWIGNQSTGTNAGENALVSFLYSRSGTSPAGTKEATTAQIGTTWGLAWNRTTKTIYAAAFLKRHAGFGPNGPGAIYQVSAGADGVMGTADDTPSLFLNLTSLSGVSVGADPHSTASTETCVIGANDWCHDVNAFPWVGKMALGDIDISDDDSTLYAMNLFDRKLYQIPIANPSGFSSFTAPDPGAGATGCPLDAATPAGQLNLNVRPFALKYYNGKVYLGEVCTAQSTQNRNDLRGFVYEFNGSSFTQVMNFPLTFPRGVNGDGLDESWNPWRDVTWPTVYGTFGSENYVANQQPWLVDIEFDRGNMILGFRDRFGDQSGYQAGDLNINTNAVYNGVGAGDIYRACANGAGGWTLESNATCGGVTTAGANNGQGPGPGPGPNTGYGEYYYQDNINSDHLNVMVGGLSQVPGYLDVAGTAIDPVNLMTNGVLWLRNSTGQKTRGYELIGNPGAYGKANGMGDLELLCNAAPIEIGNRAWNDVNGNGVQDAGEPGLNGVQVTLSWPGGSINTTTSVDGNYVFTREASTGAYSQTLASNKAYTITFGVPAGYTLTVPNAQALAGASVSSNDAISDVRDSDAVLIGNVPTIVYTTGSAGKNNHGLDAGYTQPVSASVNITNTPPVVVPASGAVVLRKIVTTTDGSNPPSVSGAFEIALSCGATQNLSAGGSVTVSNLVSGTQCAATENTLSLPIAPSGYTWAGVQNSGMVTVTSNQTGTITVTNLLAPMPPQPSSVLTVTKVVNGAAQAGRVYTMTVSGPSGYDNTFTLTETAQLTRVLTGLLPGIYTVTEQSPGSGWVTTYSVTSGSDIASGANAVVTLTNAITATPFIVTQITGTVYNDYNSDGLMTANGVVTDTGVQSVTVTAIALNGTTLGPAQTNASGVYTLSTGGAQGPYRLEFTNLPAGYEPSRAGAQNGTSVQFINNAAQASDANFGVVKPCDYCQNDPYLATSSIVNGDNNGLITTTYPTVWLFRDSRGTTAHATAGPGTSPLPLTPTLANQIGTVYGQAYQNTSKSLFFGTFVRAYTGFPAGGSTGSIYRVTPGADGVWGSADDSTSLFVDLNTLFGSPVAGATPNWATNGGAASVGFTGYGDLDMSEDGTTLYAMNLADHKVYQIPLGSDLLAPTAPAISTQVKVSPRVPTLAGCAFDEVPFGLAVKDGIVYAAQKCSNSLTSPTTYSLTVYALNPTTNIWVSTPALNARVNTDRYRGDASNYTWLAPVDVVFDRGDMVISARSLQRDRSTDSGGVFGDMLRACAAGSGAWVMESAAVCGTRISLGASVPSNEGFPLDAGGLPDGNSHEYYYEDYGEGNENGIHGGLAQIPGRGEVAAIHYDAFYYVPASWGTGGFVYEAGVSWLNNDTGQRTRTYQFYREPREYAPTLPVNAKFGTLGDLEALCDPAPIELGNRVWNDVNGDGVQDPGEPGLNGVQVTLSWPGGSINTTTSVDGNYYFTREAATGAYSQTLAANKAYTITFAVPAGMSMTVPNAQALSGASVSSNDAISDVRDSDAVLIGNVPTILYTTGNAGKNNHGLDAGFVQVPNASVTVTNTPPSVNLGNQVWFDTNNNGVIDAGEQGVQNVRVELYRDNGDGVYTPGVDQYIAFSNTVAGGYYTFSNLAEGGYVVVITGTNFNLGNTLAGYVSSTPTENDPNANVDNNDNGIPTGVLGSGGYVASRVVTLTLGSEPSTTVNAGDSNWTVDFGFYRLQVGDQVWLDSNNNGVRDAGEQPIANVAVAILDNSGNVVQTTATDASGLYTFTGLISGTYVISITPPAGYVSSDGQTTTDAGNDTDHGAPNGNFITSQPFALTPGGGGVTNDTFIGNGTTQNLNLDFGLYVPVSLGNRVWFDTNNDGLDNELGTLGSSIGVAGVTVQLYQDSNGDGVFSAGDTLLSSTTTSATGYYSFTQLKPTTFPTQTYLVVLPASNFTGVGPLYNYQSSADIVSTSQPDANRDYDDNGEVLNGMLGLGGFVASRAITLTSGNEPAGEVNGANDLTLDTSSNLTLDFGFYKLVLGNQVWRDTNNDGLLNNGEQGIPNLAVTLLDNAGNVVSSTTTDASGFYTFTNLISGTYVVSATTPAQHSTSLGAGNAYEPAPNPNTVGADSDDNGTSSTGLPASPFAVSAPLNLTPGSTNGGASPNNNNGTTVNPNLDFGFYPLGVNLGNQVWFDTNNNGVIDGSEQGVSGVAVELYRDTNNDGVYTPGVDAYVGARTTVAGGYYTFTGLMPDNYVVVITSTNFAVGGALLGYQNSTPVEADINANADSQNNGIPYGALGSSTGYVASKAISLTLGGEPSQTVVAGDSNWTVDFGFYRLELGNTVWNDKNNNGVQDNGESGVPNITVTLFNNGSVVSTTFTDANGVYGFTNLVSGTYSMSIAMPAGYQSSNDIASTGTPISADRDDNGQGGGTMIASTAPFDLTPGLNLSGVQTATDSNGVTVNPSVDFGIWQPVSLGNQVWFDTNNNGVLDLGEAGVSGVAVELYRDNGDGVYTPGVDQLAGSTTTIAGGYYTFTNLLEGGYIVVIPGTNFTSGALAGYRSSAGAVNGNDDLNNRDHGIENTGATSGSPLGFVSSNVVTLTVGGEPANDDLGSNGIDANGNGTLDFGFYKLELGNLVWEDKNNNGIVDSGEPVIPNITVELRDPVSDALISTTLTNAGGYYTFTNLISGTYRVVLPASNFDPGGALASLTSSTGVNGSASGPFEPGVNESNDLSLENNDHGSVFGTLGGAGVVRSGVITLTPGAEPVVTNNAALSQQPTIDFGLFKPAGLGNYVWYDLNHDGVQNNSPGEAGVSGVTVTLFSNGVPVSTTFTDATGFYVFTNLVQGTYSVTFQLPGTLTFTVPSATTPDASDADSDAKLINGQTGSTDMFNLGYGEWKPQIDAGVWQPAGLGDTVWIDTNGDGVQNNGEPGMPGVTATLFVFSPTTNSFVQLSQTVTGNGGYYEFTNLISATYQVQFSTPAGYTWTTPTAGSPISDSNVITPSMGGTAPVVLNAGEFNPTIDGGLVPFAALGDVMWEDINHNGFQDNGEPGVNGVQVTLYLNGAPIRTATTANVLGTDGYYTFTGLISGTYSVTFGLPIGYQWTLVTANSADTTLTNAGGVKDSNVVDLIAGSTSAIALKWGDQNPTIDAGIWRPASLGDYVWEDFNHDGQQNDGNAGINGVAVKLLDNAGNVISTTTTFTGGPLNQPGYYTFTNLISGTYSVQFTLPSAPQGSASYTWTLPNSGNDVSDSDAGITGTTGSYTLFPGDSIPTVDAGVWRPASLGDTVWFDINHNGVQDGGAEVGVPNITVKLLDGNGNVVSTTVTDASGLYTFTNLISSTYQVQFDLATLPAKYQPTVQGINGSKDLTDSDASPISGLTEKITLVAGENDKSWDFGIWLPASLGDFVWEDLNHNGVQDGNEPGVPGVTVTLLSNGGQVVSTTVTNSSGYYSFTQLVPTNYTVVFTPPASYTYTLPTVGITTTDSDPNPINGWTVPVILAPGEHNPTIDAGLWRPMSLGNQVWFDTNDNGKIDAGEKGVDGVVVQLYFDNGDGVLNTATDTLTKTTVTASGGYYTFTQLISGTYFAVIPTMNFIGTGALVRYQSSDPTASNPNNDVDNDDNGITIGALGLPNGYVASGGIVMRPGTEPTTANGEVAANGGDSDVNTNWTNDFGFYTLSLGNLVWNDINNDGVRGGSEAGVPNVGVTLLDVNGTAISSTVTDANGAYTFTNLLSGTYSVRITPAAGWQSSSDIATSANPNNDADNDDNGVGGAGGSITSNPITLWPGSEPQVNNSAGASSNTTLDFGIWRPFSLGNRVWNDVNNNGEMDAADGGAPGIDGVLVRLLNTQGNELAVTTTANGGYYRFDRLLAGDYIVEIAASNFITGNPLAGLRSSYIDDNNPNSDVDRNDNGIGRTPSITQGIRSGVVTLGTDAAPAEPTGESDLAPGGQGTDDNRANMTVDFGFFGPLVHLGNQVWFDTNDNGVIDAGEQGVSGVLVELYRDTNNDTVFTPGVDVYVGNRTTLAGGWYTFTNLAEGSYVVVIAGTNFGANGALAGYRSSDPTENDPNANGDNNDNGIEYGVSGTQPAYVASRAIVLNVSEEPSKTIAAGDSNWTIDFGFYRLQLGNQVWLDVNQNGQLDAGEPGIANVTVALVDAQGNVISTTVTDAGGNYLFTGVLSGTYTVRVTPPSGLQSTTDIGSTANPNNDVDSDDNGNGAGSGAINSNQITLRPGAEPGVNNADATSVNLTVDFGLTSPAMVVVKKTAMKQGSVKAGDLVTYTLVVSNPGTSLARNVVLTDPLPAGTAFVSASSVPAMPITHGPPTVWRIGDMPPGMVMTATFSVRVTEGAGSIVNQARVEFNNRPSESVVVSSDQVVNPVAPTAVTLAKFVATLQSGGVRVLWQTSLERDTFGFNVWRSASGNRADAVKVNGELIVAKGGNVLTEYSIDDAGGSVNAHYWLEEIELDGTRNEYGPVVAGATLPGASQAQPAVQPAVNAGVGVAGGVLVAQPMAQRPAQADQNQAPDVTNQGAAPVAAVVLPAQEPQAVPNNASQAQPAQSEAQPVQPNAQSAQVQPAQPAQVPQPVVQQPRDSSIEVKTDAVAVARGGQAVQPTLRQAQGNVAAPVDAAQPVNPLLPLVAGVLALFGVGAAGVFMARRRKR